MLKMVKRHILPPENSISVSDPRSHSAFNIRHFLLALGINSFFCSSLILSLFGCVSVGKLLSHALPPIPYLQSGNNKRVLIPMTVLMYVTTVLDDNEILSITLAINPFLHMWQVASHLSLILIMMSCHTEVLDFDVI